MPKNITLSDVLMENIILQFVLSIIIIIIKCIAVIRVLYFFICSVCKNLNL